MDYKEKLKEMLSNAEKMVEVLKFILENPKSDKVKEVKKEYPDYLVRMGSETNDMRSEMNYYIGKHWECSVALKDLEIEKLKLFVELVRDATDNDELRKLAEEFLIE